MRDCGAEGHRQTVAPPVDNGSERDIDDTADAHPIACRNADPRKRHARVAAPSLEGIDLCATQRSPRHATASRRKPTRHRRARAQRLHTRSAPPSRRGTARDRRRRRREHRSPRRPRPARAPGRPRVRARRGRTRPARCTRGARPLRPAARAAGDRAGRRGRACPPPASGRCRCPRSRCRGSRSRRRRGRRGHCTPRPSRRSPRTAATSPVDARDCRSSGS